MNCIYSLRINVCNVLNNVFIAFEYINRINKQDNKASCKPVNQRQIVGLIECNWERNREVKVDDKEKKNY